MNNSEAASPASKQAQAVEQGAQANLRKTYQAAPGDSLGSASVSFTADLFSIVGFPLTLMGLYFAWRQLRKTQGATEAAVDAAKKAVRRLGSMEVSGELGACNELLKLVMTDIHASLFESARSRVLDVIIRMTRISAGDGHLDQVRKGEITEIVASLQRGRELLNSGITPGQVSKVDKLVAENIQKLATVQGAIKISGVSENG